MIKRAKLPRVRQRMHVAIDIEGTNVNGETIVRVSGTFLEVDEQDSALYLTMDDVLVTDDVCALFGKIQSSFKRLKRN
jgi:hypothetical protein